MAMSVSAKYAYFIKLGQGGEWETESLEQGVIRFGYWETPHELCTPGAWEKVRDFWAERRRDAGAATRDMKQIRAFYESDDTSIFITFANGLLYWCRPVGAVEVLPDKTRLRKTLNGWSSRSLGGVSLSSDRISGHLQKVQMFRGTICQVKQREYLLRKLNDDLSPEVLHAEEAERKMITAIVGLLRLLTWQDFELLVDLVFSASGWRRVGMVGRAQKTVDLDLVLPSTGERAFAQIKSHANGADLLDYTSRFEQAALYDRMFFVWHTGSVPANTETDGLTIVGPERLAQMCLDAGLATWLREKVS